MIDLLRHGETTRRDAFCGSTDVELSARGWTQLRDAVRDGAPWDAIFTSPLRRCAEFALECATRWHLPLTIDPRWREMDFGTWEGKSAAEISARAPDALARFWARPDADPPPHGGESFQHFEARVLEVWNALRRAYPQKRVLVVTHGGVIRVLLRQAHGLSIADLPRIEVPHASLHHIAAAPIP